MAYVVARRNGRFEIRESQHTAKGPRARTLAGFRVLAEAILARAEAKAMRPFDVDSVLASAERAGAPIELSMQAKPSTRRHGEMDRDAGEMDRDAFVRASRRMAVITASPRPQGSRADAGEALIELLGFADAVRSAQPPTHPGFAGAALDPESKARRLRRFLGPLVHEDASQAELWRGQSEAAHAEAGAQLSDLAAQLAVQTGRGKDRDEMFPGLSSFARARARRTAE